MIYYVSQIAKENGDGTKERPFLTMNEAAQVAVAGDEVVVAPGIYREYVNPQNGGTDENNRIVYRSLKPLEAVITGAEIIKNWTKISDNVWKAVVPNGVFGNYNPYVDEIFGDWYFSLEPKHTGEVFLNGKAMYEAFSMDEVENAEKSESSWEGDASRYKWMTAQADGVTEFYANFLGKDPNRENVEITVRKNCFMPDRNGVNYITVSGFTITQAATNWAPPTAYQDGMIGPHWAKGWIIEDCEISNSKCSGISLGKYLQPYNDNKWSREFVKDGTQNERDIICRAVYEGWTKENIGSHIVRRCCIHDCGQTGIVGHLGGAFSVIEDNEIYNINNKQDLTGAEIAGIKMHAAIDVIYRRNHIHHCTRGIWLDWQAQGTRVTQNLFHDNVPPLGVKLASDISIAEDLFIEVSHGPTLVDNNLFLSPCAGRLSAQGIAYVNNLVAGSFTWVGEGTDNEGKEKCTQRYTPYHIPHRTEVAGFMTFLHGDARFYNNIFVQPELREDLIAATEKIGNHGLTKYNFICGTKPYDGYPLPEEYFARFTAETAIQRFGVDGSTTNRDMYYDHLPVYTDGNFYYNHAQPFDQEQNFVVDSEHEITIKLKEENGRYTLDTNLYEHMPDFNVSVVSTQMLGKAFEPEERFENPDGSEILLNRDYLNSRRMVTTIPGPFAKAYNGEVLAISKGARK